MTIAFYKKTDENACGNFEDLLSALPKSFSFRVNEKRSKKGKIESLFAYLLLFGALKILGKDPYEYEIVTDEFGKPFFKGNPLYFNLSHSKGVSFCVLSDEKAGCDVEKIREINLKIAEKHFSLSERESVFSKFSKPEREAEFFKIWTRKESYLKALGAGIRVPLSSFTTELKTEIVDGKAYYLETEIIEGYAFSVCSADENVKIKEL